MLKLVSIKKFLDWAQIFLKYCSYSAITFFYRFIYLFLIWERICVTQVILFKVNCEIFYTNLHELFRQFISWTNWLNSGKSMGNCWISCQVMAGMKKVYDNLIIVNLYVFTSWLTRNRPLIRLWCPRSKSNMDDFSIPTDA